MLQPMLKTTGFMRGIVLCVALLFAGQAVGAIAQGPFTECEDGCPDDGAGGGCDPSCDCSSCCNHQTPLVTTSALVLPLVDAREIQFATELTIEASSYAQEILHVPKQSS